MSAQGSAMLEIGQPAPDFTLQRDGGGDVTLSGERPTAIVLYFYPKDDTSGCTREAIEFSEYFSAFDEAGAKIYGISRDTVTKHEKFINKYELKVGLLADLEGTVCEAYGTWVDKQMYGKSYKGIERSTFLIDGTGTIRQIWRKVKVPDHAEQVLEAVKAL
ncbi:MAG: peroxiredoxin Q/BCP [Paracoccaceae bacterium]|jgi:peroxiredoxin Q/BCP